MANLSELLMALAISLFLLSGAYKVLFIEQANLQSQLKQIELLQGMLGSRYELKRVEMGPKLAACGQIASVLAYANLVKDQADRIRLAQGTTIQAFHLQNVPNLGLDKPGPGMAISNTDVLIARMSSEHKASLVHAAQASNETIVVAGDIGLKPGNIVVLSDCLHVITNKVMSVAKRGTQLIINLQHPVQFDFKVGAKLSQFKFEAIYVGESGRMDNRGKPINSLYVQDLKGVRHELVPGIENLQFRLWVKPFHNTGWYQNLDQAHWQDVKALIATIKLKDQENSVNYRVVIDEG
jgi:hypothetical protein